MIDLNVTPGYKSHLGLHTIRKERLQGSSPRFDFKGNCSSFALRNPI